MPQLTPATKVLLIAGGIAILLYGYRQAAYYGYIPRPPVLQTLIPLKSEIIQGRDTELGSVTAKALPSTQAATLSSPAINYEIWAWNAQMGLIYANGGPKTTQRSFMEQRGVNLHLKRQDDTGQMQTDLITFATALAHGEANPQTGTHFVTIMGDGAAQFFAALNSQLAKLGNEYHAEIVACHGYSRGEDGFWGLPAWKKDAKNAKGALIAGVLRDGDWNIAEDWEAQNGIANNPDDKVYDPDAVNWVNAADYTKAAELYVQGFCEDLPVKGHRETVKHVCVDGVVTWTPGDVTIAKKRGGLVPLLTTKQNRYQMPAVMIGIHKWNQAHAALLNNLLAASFEAADQIKTNPAALQRAGEASFAVYNEESPDYWIKYYKGVEETDAKGVRVPLGGSTVSNLADNLALFGLDGGSSIMSATYKHFGDIVVQQYPALVPSYPPIGDVLDTTYVQGAKNLLGGSGNQSKHDSYLVEPANSAIASSYRPLVQR